MLRVPEPPIPEEELHLFRIGRTALIPAVVHLLLAGLLIAFGVAIAGADELGADPSDRYLPMAAVGLLVLVTLAVAVVSILEVVNSRVRITRHEVVIRDWLGRERRVPLEDIWAMRLCLGQPKWALLVRVSGSSRVRLELLPRNEDDRPVAVMQSRWWGRMHAPPGEYTRLTAAIAGRRQMALISDGFRGLPVVSRYFERVRYWRR